MFQHHKWVYFYLQDLFTLSKTKGMGPSKKVCVRVKRTLKVSSSGIPVRLGGRTEWPEKAGGSMAWWHGGSQRPRTGGKPHLRHLQGRRHSADRGRRVQGWETYLPSQRSTATVSDSQAFRFAPLSKDQPKRYFLIWVKQQNLSALRV